MTSITLAIISALMLYFSYAIGIKKNLKLLHDYHYQNLKQSNINVYPKIMGIGLFVIGVSFFVQACILYLYSSLNILVLIAGLVIGIGVMIYAQYKYNGGIFS